MTDIITTGIGDGTRGTVGVCRGDGMIRGIAGTIRGATVGHGTTIITATYGSAAADRRHRGADLRSRVPDRAQAVLTVPDRARPEAVRHAAYHAPALDRARREAVE